MSSNKENIEISKEPETKKHKTENLNLDEIRKKLLENLINKDGNIKTNEDLVNQWQKRRQYLKSMQRSF